MNDKYISLLSETKFGDGEEMTPTFEVSESWRKAEQDTLEKGYTCLDDVINQDFQSEEKIK